MNAERPPSTTLVQNAESRHWWKRWWRRLPPARQDRFATLAPLLAVLLFLLAIAVAITYLRLEELDREQEAVTRDVEYAQQRLRLRLLERQEQLMRVAREISDRAIEASEFEFQADALVSQFPELQAISWIDARRNVIAVHASPSAPARMQRLPGSTLTVSETDGSFELARDLSQPVYSRPLAEDGAIPSLIVQVPLTAQGRFAGTVMGEYSIDGLLRFGIPPEVMARYAVALMDDRDRVLAGSLQSPNSVLRLLPWSDQPLEHAVPVSPVGNGLILKAQGYRTSKDIVGTGFFWVVGALSALTVWMLLGTWRHTRRRVQAQQALVAETNFRRAMENSMLTGMRTIDMEGRITYVNPAFCAMTGFSEDELIDTTPPYPYWPRDRLEEFHRLFQQELMGRSPADGLELNMARRDGSQFVARMYVSPLIDAEGNQTGWMTSVTNITEAKRVRDQLTAAHERFTTVLEGLDAAVSVMSVQRGEMLFANRSYRIWFGGNPAAHAQLTGGRLITEAALDGDESVDDFGGLPTQKLTDAGSDTHEVYLDSVQKWFDVRARYVQWTDGNLAQMLIATDITARKQAEDAAARQAEKSQFTSRLITMGEMASTVAHELNQPLAAISNYCSGMISRVQAGNIDDEQLIGALEKTSRQAQRAGQIIHRIRQFVKRSAPQRQPSRVRDITDAVIELAMFEMKRRRVTLNSTIANRLPQIMADPILIEQVLLNLLKNAAEAIDSAQMPQSRRHIELRVQQRQLEDQGQVVEFSVTDTGPGMKEDMLSRLFEAFHSTKAEGLGIGLSLCRSIIESHHGRIKAENIYNDELISGCRFTFTLPIDNADETS